MNKQLINAVYIKEFTNGLSLWDIAKKYNNTYKNVSESITGHRFEARLLPIEEKERIIELYNNGNSTVKIGKMYGVNNKCIANVLEEYNIPRDQKRFVRQYSIDEMFFDNIDTPNKAYCLGILAADGCNYPQKSTISMSLEECDKEILEKICLVMNNTHPLEYIDYTEKHDFGYTYKNQYRMLIFSSHMCKALANAGVIPNKSNQLTFPSFLTEELISHYFRGLFDGDGSLGFKDCYSFDKKSKTKKLSISITSTFSICKGLSEYLNDKFNIYSYISEASNHNGITHLLTISRQNDVDLFLEWIYKDADLFLKRKHDLYLRYKYVQAA